MKKQALQARQLQAEALVKVGLTLTHTREQRQFSVEDLATKTHIPARLLQAIEQADMSQLPEPVYIQSFIRQYANAMGINGVQIASEFPVEPVVRTPGKSLIRTPSWQLRPAHLYAGYMLVILGAIQGLSYAMNRSASQLPASSVAVQNHQGPQAAPNAVGPVPPPATTRTPPNGVANPNQTPNQSAQSVRVALTLTDSSWVKLIVDGKDEFEGTMTPGDKRLLVGNKRVTITAGNAGGVVATFNGGEAKPLGEPGSVQEVSFPPEAKDMARVNSTRMAQNTDQ
jgi:cytoskeletal protein RodZ